MSKVSFFGTPGANYKVSRCGLLLFANIPNEQRVVAVNSFGMAIADF
ncbi:MAG TPA: hypothetical protein VF676_13525 [Flavobacterium sp.]